MGSSISNKVKFTAILSVVVILVDLFFLTVFEVPGFYKNLTGEKYDLLPSALTIFVLLPVLGIMVLGWIVFFIKKRNWLGLLIFLIAASVLTAIIYFDYYIFEFLGIK